MTIHTFQPGDESALVSIYNEAAAHLPRFKPATLDEVRRRCHASDFDATSRFIAVENGQAVGYASFHRNGRLSYPWCRKGSEHHGPRLFDCVVQEMKERGLRQVFTAYRGDWQPVLDFFCGQGFARTRTMINYVQNLSDLPTLAVGVPQPLSPVRAEDIPTLLTLYPRALRAKTAVELEQHLLHNPYFSADETFTLRQRADGSLLAVGILITNPAYADPRQVDADMPCFRLGAFGTEGMQVKRLRGLFSILPREDRDAIPLGLDALAQAATRLQRAGLDCFAAQAPSDAEHLVRFYEHYFRRQGSFPVLERSL